MWAEHEWKGYLDSEEAITAAIAYVNENPIREGKPAEHCRLSQRSQVLTQAG
jgi:hypothetical protein